MEVGYFIKYGRLVPGREEKAIELFGETITFWQKHLTDGRITFFEPVGFATGDHEVDLGFFFIKGYEEKLNPILASEEYRTLLTRAGYVVDHLQTEFLVVGEEVMRQAERSAKVAPEFALV
jgi:hypothetical protein